MDAQIAQKKSKSMLRSDTMQRLLAFAGLIILFIGFSLASPNFFQFDNIVGILIATTVNGILALGATFVIITSGIDLSIGTVMTLSAVMTGVLRHQLGNAGAVGHSGWNDDRCAGRVGQWNHHREI